MKTLPMAKLKLAKRDFVPLSLWERARSEGNGHGEPLFHYFGQRIAMTVLAVLLAATVSACVTINIYFPAAAAEKAADKIIDEVWQLQKQGDAPAPAKPVEQK